MPQAVSGWSGEPTLAQLEALLFVAERPLSRRELAAVLRADPAVVDALVEALGAALDGRGLRLVAADDRIELATAPEAGEVIARYLGQEGLRLSPAALETLAIVAYRQPVTRSVIEEIRGVDSEYVLRGLLHRRLVVELGRAALPGRPYLYGTSFEFLERFGLSRLGELPPLDAEALALLARAPGADVGVEALAGRATAGPAEPA